MPTWIRIIILLVIYLIFLFFAYINIRISLKNNEKQKEDEKRSKKKIIIANSLFYIIIILLGELAMNFLLFPSYRFLSILKICMHAIYYLAICFCIVGCTAGVKKKVKDTINTVFAILLMVSFVFYMIALSCSSTDIYSYENSFWNPVEIVETDHEEYESVGPTLDVYALDNEKEYHKSIGYNTNTGDYFYYYKGTNNGVIAETTISKNDIKSKNHLPEDEDTRVVIIKKTRSITRSEFKKSSEKYKTEETETKYRLYLNTKQIVPVEK